ncbi:hypothetical protein O9Z70_05065 [Devosia sp. YIM 151766]|uniref:hypothetical protein n=1 Tax=Devosia sp. YIM 151766 TaxID=3017325 RepID=UPI00255CD14B|nr:hypothetical protein [Devosia sp. YIM 151766]WIY53910.1 hypothetical protein O9Z70_05065 [Devosia sp. YIM 151766]
MMAPSEPPVALVLAGGGRLGAVQVGMLRALVETGLRPAFAIGSSVLEGDGGLVPDSMPRGYKARTEQLILVHRLCLGLELPQQIPQRFEAANVAAALAARDAQIAALEVEVAQPKAGGRDLAPDGMEERLFRSMAE